MQLINGDCLVEMNNIADESIDMILCDLPYGTTKNKWDTKIDLDELWRQYKRIIKRRGCIALFAQTPFDKVLGCSNLEMLKYEWIWQKTMATGQLNCHFAPMKIHENILIFSKSAASFVQNTDNAMVYNPQYRKGKPYSKWSGHGSKNYGNQTPSITNNDGEHYMPLDVITFAKDKERLHPTQKPVALCEYLIKTYTNVGDVVLDNCMGVGTTGLACQNSGRDFIGIELDKNYYDIAVERIDANEQIQST